MNIKAYIFAGLVYLFPVMGIAAPKSESPRTATVSTDTVLTSPTPKISLLTIITTSDPQAQLMALVLSRSALAQGETLGILLCSSAGDLALKDPPATTHMAQQPMGNSPAGLLRQLVSQNVKVQVCATYLPNRQLGAQPLLDGVGVATPPEVAKVFIDRTVRLLSF